MVNTLKVFLTLAFVIISSNSWALSTDCSHAILIDYSSGDILFEKNATSKMYPSSMTKLMTVYVTLKESREGRFNLNDKFKISKKAWQMKGSKMFLNQGEMVSGIDLIKGVIVLSGNDAAVAIAEAVAGSEDKFAKLMNIEAEKLGLQNSHFINSSGLTAKGHHMSASDIARLSVKLYEDFPQYYNIFSMGELSYANITQPNRNSLLSEPGIDGLKTGSTDAGGYGLAFTAERNGRRIVGVVNGLKDQFHRHREAKKLLDHAYNDFNFYKISDKNEAVVQVPVHHGASSQVAAVANRNIGVTSNSTLTNENTSIKAIFDGPVIAPIKKGQQIARLEIREGESIKIIPLYAKDDVTKAGRFGQVYQNILYKIKALIK